MRGCLLDTDVVSEFSKQHPHAAVVDLVVNRNDLWLSVVVLQELEMGVQLLPEGHRRDGLRGWLSQLVTDFEERVLPIERREAEWAATFRARAHRNGWKLELADALIAGTAKTNELSVVTRNVRDFDGLDIDIVNPWESP